MQRLAEAPNEHSIANHLSLPLGRMVQRQAAGATAKLIHEHSLSMLAGPLTLCKTIMGSANRTLPRQRWSNGKIVGRRAR